MNAKRWFIIGALSGAIGVALGAIGAHALPGMLAEQEIAVDRIAKRVEWLEVGVRYQMYHALAIVVIAILKRSFPEARTTPAAVLFTLGTLLFSGSLYAMAFLDLGVHMIVPLGGVCLIVGWALAAALAWPREAF